MAFSKTKCEPRVLSSRRHLHPPRTRTALTAHAVNPATLLDRHVTGDWSNLSSGDIKANRDAVADGARVLSSYHIAPKIRIWLITEASRASNTILLQEEY
jgi:hypothetical protein